MHLKRWTSGGLLALVVAIGGSMAGGGAAAMDAEAELKLGENEFMSSCAACHGANARGSGPVADVLRDAPSDLTQISKNFGGTFPADHIYQVIDGGKMVNPHGDRNMPVWGYRYLAEALERAGQLPHDVDAQKLTKDRITALVKYLESIQAN